MTTESTICKSAAHMVAALHSEGLATNLSRESRDSLALLTEELEELGYMAPYATEAGGYEV